MIPCNENMIRLDVVAFLATLQLVIPDTCNSDKIKGFGSGFLLRHKDRLFLLQQTMSYIWMIMTQLTRQGKE